MREGREGPSTSSWRRMSASEAGMPMCRRCEWSSEGVHVERLKAVVFVVVNGWSSECEVVGAGMAGEGCYGQR